jgi:antitoxin component of MazEF toxin-antitoxin module
MIKKLAKVGNSNALIFDAAMMDLARLKTGDQVNVEIHAGGTITLTPIRPHLPRTQVTKTIKSTMKDYARTMKRLDTV